MMRVVRRSDAAIVATSTPEASKTRPKLDIKSSTGDMSAAYGSLEAAMTPTNTETAAQIKRGAPDSLNPILIRMFSLSAIADPQTRTPPPSIRMPYAL